LFDKALFNTPNVRLGEQSGVIATLFPVADRPTGFALRKHSITIRRTTYIGRNLPEVRGTFPSFQMITMNSRSRQKRSFGFAPIPVI
jgi:hypothetical protein